MAARARASANIENYEIDVGAREWCTADPGPPKTSL
jgi:hypothetical protein